jgi:predicted RNase H-like nuclease (RuvC/YqgF family)
MSNEQKLEVALARLEERVEALQEDMKEMRSDMSELRATANRWRGAFWVMMGLGGVVGVMANLATGWFR